jgi:peptidoglycan/xylan/chitin deacetylase (PgdA/CDA1 family)
MMRWLPLCLAALAVLGSRAQAQSAPSTQPNSPPIILLKLDDVAYWISPRWKRVEEYLKQRNIHASFGIIGQGLEKAGPDTVNWIKAVHDEGQIEFWFHGYLLSPPKDANGKFLPGEWQTGTEQEQAALLKKIEDLSLQKLGFELNAFGPHWTGTTDATDQALEETPQIKIWLYGPVHPKYFTRLSIPRIMALENPTFIPSFEKFKATYEKIGCKQSVLLLQGHPDMWVDPMRWEGFTSIIKFLQAQGCTFMTPTEYAQSIKQSPVKTKP